MTDEQHTPGDETKLNKAVFSKSTAAHEEAAKAIAGRRLKGRLALGALAVTAVLSAIGLMTKSVKEGPDRVDVTPKYNTDDNTAKPGQMPEKIRQELERERASRNQSSALPPTQQFAEVSASVDSPYEARQVVTPTVVTAPPRPGGMG